MLRVERLLSLRQDVLWFTIGILVGGTVRRIPQGGGGEQGDALMSLAQVFSNFCCSRAKASCCVFSFVSL